MSSGAGQHALGSGLQTPGAPPPGDPRPGRSPVRILAGIGAGLLIAVLAVTIQSRLTAPTAADLPAGGRQVLDQLNAIRTRAGCPPLHADAALTAMAGADAQDMVTRGYLSSVAPGNEDAAVRAQRFGYRGLVTENYAAGLSTAGDVATLWTSSGVSAAAPIAARIRTCSLVSAGIGHDPGTALPALGAHVWVMVLGDR